MIKQLLTATALLCLGGCSILNPYPSDFSCPDTGFGKCVSVQAAYKEAKKPSYVEPPAYEGEEKDGGVRNEAPASTSLQPDNTEDKATISTVFDEAPEKPVKPLTENKLTLERRPEPAESQYKKALYSKMQGLLKEPATPVVAPPKAMRVLFLPYTGDSNEMYMLRYVYLLVDEPRFILGDSVYSGGDEE